MPGAELPQAEGAGAPPRPPHAGTPALPEGRQDLLQREMAQADDGVAEPVLRSHGLRRAIALLLAVREEGWQFDLGQDPRCIIARTRATPAARRESCGETWPQQVGSGSRGRQSVPQQAAPGISQETAPRHGFYGEAPRWPR